MLKIGFVKFFYQIEKVLKHSIHSPLMCTLLHFSTTTTKLSLIPSLISDLFPNCYSQVLLPPSNSLCSSPLPRVASTLPLVILS